MRRAVLFIVSFIWFTGVFAQNCNFPFGAYKTAGQWVTFWHSYNGTPGSILWEFGDGDTSTLNNPTHTYANNGTYIYSLTIDSCGKKSDTIVMPAGTRPCDAGFTRTISSNDLTIYPNGVGNDQWYFVDYGDGNGDTAYAPNFAGSFVHTYASTGGYKVNLTVHDTVNQCMKSESDSIVIGNVPVCDAAFFIDTALSSPTKLLGFNVSQPYNASGVTVKYFWDFGDGDTSNLAYPSHTYNAVGIYTVCLAIRATDNTTNNYCVDQYCVQINILQAGTVLEFHDINTFSLSEENGLFAYLYPNPASDVVFIEGDFDRAQLTVLDVSGRSLISQVLSGSRSYSVPVSSWPKGVYLMRISKDGFTVNKKVIVH